MVVLALGDVVGEAGCGYVREKLPGLRKFYDVDMVMANGENSAQGNGITPKSAKHLFDSGVDVITTGNHCLRRREAAELLDQKKGVLRPANYHHSAPGSGVYLYDACRFQVCIVNLQGNIYMQHALENPFACMDRLLEKPPAPVVIVDFHAEATAEKQCLGHYLDGRVTAVLGTHTHIPTADARVLPKGTGYITDLGMCGGLNSSLGVKVETAIYSMRTNLPVKFEEETKDIRINGVVLDIDEKAGMCREIQQIAWL